MYPSLLLLLFPQITLKKETGVLTKEHTQWKWEVISELLEGPLQNASLARFCNRHRFFHKLLQFFQPVKGNFGEYSKYVFTSYFFLQTIF